MSKGFNRASIITDWDVVPVVFDIPMAARILGTSVVNVEKRCRNGQLPAFKDGRLWRFEKEVFRSYIERCRNGRKEEAPWR